MATYYINSDSGVDSGAGSSGAPWLTLAYAYAHSTTGDTIIAQKATAVYSMGTSASTSMAGRTLTAVKNGDAVFTGVSKTWNLDGTFNISNLIFTGCVATQYGGILGWNASTSLVLTVNNCTFNNTVAYGNYTWLIGGTQNPTNAVTVNFINCLVNDLFNNGQGNNGFLQVWTSSPAVTFNMTGCTIAIKTDGGYNLNSVLANNGTLTTVVKNCIIYNTSGRTVTYGGGTATLTYSDTYNITSPTAGTGNITSDPLFVDAPNSNYNLRQTSPCLDSASVI